MSFGNIASCRILGLCLRGVAISKLIRGQLIQFAFDPFGNCLMRYLLRLSLRLRSRSWCGLETCLQTRHCTLRGSCGYIRHRLTSEFGHRRQTNFFHFRWIKVEHFGNLNHPFLNHSRHHSYHLHHRTLNLNLECYQNQNQQIRQTMSHQFVFVVK